MFSNIDPGNSIKNLARQAIENENLLLQAADHLETLKGKAKRLANDIESASGLQLWSAIPGPPSYTWIMPGQNRKVSISYSTAVDAYRALLNDTIQWQE